MKTFGALRVGERFRFGGVDYKKTALTLAENSEREGHVFLEETEVEVIEEQKRQPA
jgi:hypothetical protein